MPGELNLLALERTVICRCIEEARFVAYLHSFLILLDPLSFLCSWTPTVLSGQPLELCGGLPSGWWKLLRIWRTEIPGNWHPPCLALNQWCCSLEILPLSYRRLMLHETLTEISSLSWIPCLSRMFSTLPCWGTFLKKITLLWVFISESQKSDLGRKDNLKDKFHNGLD